MSELQERLQAALLAHPEPDGLAAAEAFVSGLSDDERVIAMQALHAEVARRRTWDGEPPPPCREETER
jgi:hypothetical protein